MVSSPALALNRFGLGARPDVPAPADTQRWLLSQFERFEPVPSHWRPVRHTPELFELWVVHQREVLRAPESERGGLREAYARRAREDYFAGVGARAGSALQTPAPFVERLVHFWSNHFAVSVEKFPVVGLASGLEADAIRPHVLGRFEDLLLAALQHPAMLLFLDQAQSVGPNSALSRRAQERQQRPRGLNENLAREILELHTLGVRSGYTQQDVTELARALTGWTLPLVVTARGSPFGFVAALHEPGARTVLGRLYPEGGEEQARAILHDLARAPATAHHIATKLARHFVADDPPPALVQSLADTYLRTGGELPAVYRELVAWVHSAQPVQAKFKTPWEWSISSLRALGRNDIAPQQVTRLMNQLGQPVWRPGSPAGYDDREATWAAPDALLRRVEVAQRLAMEFGTTLDARALAPQVLPGALTRATADALARADSGATALALLLVSPEFLRR